METRDRLDVPKLRLINKLIFTTSHLLCCDVVIFVVCDIT